MAGWLIFAVFAWVIYLIWWLDKKQVKYSNSNLTRSAGSPSFIPIVNWEGDGKYSTLVAGAAHYQLEILQSATFDGLVSSRLWPARLLVEEGNLHDANAVKVLLGDRHVGYLPRRIAARFRSELLKRCGEIIETGCHAKLVIGTHGLLHEVYVDLPSWSHHRGQLSWPNGKPNESQKLPDGRIRHLMPDGRGLTVPAEAGYRLDYISTWVGSEPDETYEVNICIIGLSLEDGYVEVWNYDIDQARNYAFHKIVKITDIRSCEIFTGLELCKQLNGVMLE